MEGSAARKYERDPTGSPSRIGASAMARDAEALGKYTVSFGLSVAITSVLSALLVVVKELNESTLLEWMKHITPHHWITHGVFDLIVFAVIGFALAGLNGGKGPDVSPGTLIRVIVGAVVLSCLIIAGFYLIMG